MPDLTANPTLTHPVTVEVRVRLEALALLEADGRYSILVPALPGCVSQADTIEEVPARVVEAAEGWLASMHDRHKENDLRTALAQGLGIDFLG